jgi:hypothetical protein
MEVVVAYSVVLDDNDVQKFFCLGKLSVDRLRRFWNQSRKALWILSYFKRTRDWILSKFKQTREKDCAPVLTAADRTSSTIVRNACVIFSHLSFIE